MMPKQETDIAIVGAGPFGLSLGAYLHHFRVRHRIFGRPMQSWRQSMPKDLTLKSDGFASTLYDPRGEFTLERFCKEQGLPYQHTGILVTREIFARYGVEFQKRMVPQLEQVDIASIQGHERGFLLQTTESEEVVARTVVLAVGITHFASLPPQLTGLPPEAVTHSFGHSDLGKFAGQRVLVVGAGASAVDIAAALADGGAEPHIMGRRPSISFYPPVMDPRPLRQRLRAPRTGLGFGWKFMLCVDAPFLFRALPEKFRLRVVRRQLGPSPGWFVKDKVQDRIPMHMSAQIQGATWADGKVHVRYDQPGNPDQEFVADHVIAATGYKPEVASLKFLDPRLIARIKTVEGTPVLGSVFQTSVPGLHMIGLAAANSFGPAQRFAVGAKWVTPRLAGYLRRRFKPTRQKSVAQVGFPAPAQNVSEPS